MRLSTMVTVFPSRTLSTLVVLLGFVVSAPAFVSEKGKNEMFSDNAK